MRLVNPKEAPARRYRTQESRKQAMEIDQDPQRGHCCTARHPHKGVLAHLRAILPMRASQPNGYFPAMPKKYQLFGYLDLYVFEHSRFMPEKINGIQVCALPNPCG
jgi:hypothetical protein